MSLRAKAIYAYNDTVDTVHALKKGFQDSYDEYPEFWQMLGIASFLTGTTVYFGLRAVKYQVLFETAIAKNFVALSKYDPMKLAFEDPKDALEFARALRHVKKDTLTRIVLN